MTESRLRYYVVDAFTDRPFSGNPAAIIPLDHWKDNTWLQSVAMEMNLSVTAYLVPRDSGYDLRWFTPKLELGLCGHATLASAVVLSRLGKLGDGAEVAFSTHGGILRAHRQGSRIRLDFPLKPEREVDPPVGLLESLKLAARYVGRSELDYLVEVDSEAAVRGIAPDFRRLAAVGERGVIVTARSGDPQFDFVSRFFAPAVGIDEDPVAGSAHCCLADYWGRRLNKSEMVGYQASERGGIVHVEVRGKRVLIGGDAVIVAEGEWLVV